MRGSIVKRRSKSKKNGKPVDLYYLVYQVGQKQKWESVPPPRTRKHAEKLLAERLSQVHGGTFAEQKRATFAEFKATWMEKYAEPEVRPSTLSMYQSLFKIHIIPHLGDKQLSSLSVEDLQGFKSRKLKEGLSPQTVKHMTRLIRQMFNHAVDWDYITRNPALKVKDPKIPKRKADFLTPKEVRLLLASLPGKHYAMILTAITSGLRIGELLAMKWSNLDWQSGTYHVQETLTRKRDTQEAGLADVKTESSAQPVDLTPTCLDALREHQREQKEIRLKREDYQDQGLVFALDSGKPMNDGNVVNRIFHPALDDAGLRRINLHSLRHTCASLLIAQGENPKYVQKQMRHASVQITFDTYGHLMPGTGRDAARRLDEVLFGKGLKVAKSA